MCLFWVGVGLFFLEVFLLFIEERRSLVKFEFLVFIFGKYRDFVLFGLVNGFFISIIC